MGLKMNNNEDTVTEDIDKSTLYLLQEIHQLSTGDSQRSELLTVSLTIAKFSSLLVVLGRKADDAHNQNITIQKWLVGLTIGIFIFTITLIVFGVIQINA